MISVCICLILLIVLLYLVYLFNEDEPVLVLFANDGCHNCQELYPTWIRLVNTTDIKKKVIRGQGCARENIHYVPEIRIYKGKHYVRYTGNRTYEDILSFINTPKDW